MINIVSLSYSGYLPEEVSTIRLQKKKKKGFQLYGFGLPQQGPSDIRISCNPKLHLLPNFSPSNRIPLVCIYSIFTSCSAVD